MPDSLFEVPLSIVLRSFLFQVLPHEPDPERKRWALDVSMSVRRERRLPAKLRLDEHFKNRSSSDEIRLVDRKRSLTSAGAPALPCFQHRVLTTWCV